MSEEAGIVFRADLLHNAAEALRREWLVTNGIGGYASATLPGANTRHYHGLLVAALAAPLGRAVLLSKLEETLSVIQTDGPQRSYELGVNLYPGVMHPQGLQWLETWEANPAPTWTWAPEPNLRLEKRIWMAHGRNITYITYRLVSAPSDASFRLDLTPLLAWRDYHSEMAACATVPPAVWHEAGPDSRSELQLTLPPIARVTTQPTLLRLQLNTSPPPSFQPAPAWYYRFQHPREQERGLEFAEDLYTPGTLSVALAAGQTVTVAAGVGEETFDAPDAAWSQYAAHRSSLEAGVDAADAFARQLAVAADAFVVQVPGRRSTVIAGYHWFSDWGRDTMIALPGLCLSTRRADVAREILLSFAEHVDGGMLPNRFPDAGETPEYNTVDATLWYFVAIWRYVDVTGDLDLIRDHLWSVLDEIVQRHRQGTRYNIHVDPADHLLYAGQPGVQLTWMDAKVGDWVVTPRIGKPVEVNALWCNALSTMADLAGRLCRTDAAASYEEQARQTAAGFARRFIRPDGRGLYDVLDTPDGGRPDASIRPNQIFALSLPFAPLTAQSLAAPAILIHVQSELVTPCGVRTLSPDDPAYRPRYEGGPAERDGAYHQGTVWPWLLGPWAEAYFKMTGDRNGALALLRPLQNQLDAYGMGTLPEVYDGSEPRRPNGCIAQAWSVAETLRVWNSISAS